MSPYQWASLHQLPCPQTWNGSLSKEVWPFCDLRVPWGWGGGATHSYSIQDVLSLETVPVSEWHSDPEMLGRASGVGMAGTHPRHAGSYHFTFLSSCNPHW